MHRLLRGLLTVVSLICLSGWAIAAGTEVRVLYIHRDLPPPPVLSNLDPVPGDLGQAGAELGIGDSNTTGKFLGQSYTLEPVILGEEDDLSAAAAALAGADLAVADLAAEDLTALAALPEAQSALIFNAGAPDDALRRAACRANLFHTLPSRAMLADALAQYLLKKKWTEWFLVEGPQPGDAAFAEALRRAAAKFGAEIVADKPWPFAADMRRTAGQEVPVFSQVGGHDVMIVADEIGDFARYLPYNTWEPRPVAGSEGLVPTAWFRVVEQWGAAQLQSRFQKLAARPMQAPDYAAWAAVRSIAEAVTRTGKADAASVRAYLLSDAFQLAAFKGRKLSFRPWNGQLRQPIPLVTARALVANAPLDGFLHPVSEMDTLGYDRREAGCATFE